MRGPISQNEDIYLNDASSHKKSWFQISVNQSNILEMRSDCDYVFCNCLYITEQA